MLKYDENRAFPALRRADDGLDRNGRKIRMSREPAALVSPFVHKRRRYSVGTQAITARVGVRSTTGVYFLIRGRQVMYVGKAKNVLARIAQHLDDPAKDFDSFAFVECAKAELADTERHYIRTICPPWNRCKTARVERQKREKASEHTPQTQMSAQRARLHVLNKLAKDAGRGSALEIATQLVLGQPRRPGSGGRVIVG